MTVLVAGGAGYIGSHFVRCLEEHGESAVVLDDLSTGFAEAIPDHVPLVRCAIGDRAAVRSVLEEVAPEAVVDFAGLIQVGESMRSPDRYYGVNVSQTIAFLDEIVRSGVKTFVFSSSAAVYGNPIRVPIDEDHPKEPINPYGATKLIVEMAARDYARAYGLRVACLRYFNAAGAHADGTLAERHDPETHLIPLAIDAGLGRRPELTVFGDDWSTPDGTCVRDYIHVMDLAEAHWLAIEKLRNDTPTLSLNLGTGNGYSVRQIIDAVSDVLGKAVPYHIGPRRDGDPPSLVASSNRARNVLGWNPTRSQLDTIVQDAVRSRT
ncbi:MAG TPA: UDP-glucose 4-epimerase GalE [Polyangiaceae bacterium]|nr:UDP-glucose 4-epimerase GalE [Polyangiaceae bacterium]HNZ23196.1 UDP-glucose 4-epimerase GalE [Polyangiaceae bacterium]HOD24462.1 UDP-glucose 4-epimerase GalE [Polyangiaceae bacterium]HOE49768.1 UDP-glucose 4-epimerase GalE [Polyangiaceae bacterium]HOH00754.1 UDP-glucose 4-epimerase GalE [Polyangiaceae bacterium]